MEVQEEPRRKFAEILGHDIYRTIEQNEHGEWVVTIDADWLPFPYRAYTADEELKCFGIDIVRRRTHDLIEHALFDQVKEYRNG